MAIWHYEERVKEAIISGKFILFASLFSILLNRFSSRIPEWNQLVSICHRSPTSIHGYVLARYTISKNIACKGHSHGLNIFPPVEQNLSLAY